jgi:hypothetical protein
MLTLTSCDTLNCLSFGKPPTPRIEATTMGKGNNSQKKEKKKPKKAAAPKAVPMKATTPPKKP